MSAVPSFTRQALPEKGPILNIHVRGSRQRRAEQRVLQEVEDDGDDVNNFVASTLAGMAVRFSEVVEDGKFGKR